MDAIGRNLPQALFLDRDGTLIKWVDYLSDPELVELAPRISETLLRAKQSGCRLFLHTNQSGVGRGYFGMDAVEAVNLRMCELMGVSSGFFDEVCIAPDDPKEVGEDSYRKPSPRFELEMIRRFGLDRERCYMIGDSLSDVQTGLNAGICSVLVRSDRSFEDGIPEEVLRYDSVSEFWREFDCNAI